MKKYCMDTSGLSNPHETMPPDIHASMWNRIMEIIESGSLAVTKEIYGEMINITGDLGNCIRNNEKQLVLEVGQEEWDWETYVEHINALQVTHERVISEYNGGRKDTVGLTDVSIIGLGKTLGLPVVSMEARTAQPSDTKKRIPEICGLEGVEHYDFNGFLRSEGIIV